MATMPTPRASKHHASAKLLRRVSSSSDIEKTLNKAVAALAFRNIPSLVVGGFAVQEHGFARLTNDVDIIVPDVEAARGWLSISGFKENMGSSMTVTDRSTRVEVDLMPGGGHVGPGPLELPMPARVSATPIIADLVTLINIKLSSYLGSPMTRSKDFSDVVELVKANESPRDLKVAKEVAPTYLTIWDGLESEK
jgi:hypothetical protein